MTRRVTHSLRARLLLLLFAAVVITACIQSFIAYRTSLDETNEIFDYQMRQMALSLRPGLNFDGVDSNSFRPDEEESFEFLIQVATMEGKVLFQSSSGTTLPRRDSTGFSLFDARGATYKLYTLRHGNQLIQVAQDRAARRSLARNLAFRTTVPITVMVLLLLFMVWWVVTSALAPVSRVQQQIATREADSLDEVDTRGLPNEVRPLVEEINLLLRRMRQAFAAQKNFVADAAHELRSPLAALKLQVEQLRRSATEKDRELATQRLGSGIERATRLVEQLLVLARQQAHSDSNANTQPVEVNRLCLLAFNDLYPMARHKHIDMGLMQGDECYVMGQEEALRIMLRNRESFALFAWEPYLHNPKLPHRLHRVTCPTLFLRGARDGLISAPYVERYAALLPNARIVTLPDCAHVPQLEQPEAFAGAVNSFLNGEG